MIPIATKKTFTVTLFAILFTSLLCVFIPQASATVTYTFAGPYYDGSLNLLPDNATVIIHATTGENYTYSFHEALIITNPAYVPAYFEMSYNFTDTGNSYTRYFWLDDLDATTGCAVTVFFSDPLTPIAFSVFGWSTMSSNFQNSAYLIITPGHGLFANDIIEKVPIDSLGDTVALLEANTLYSLIIISDDDSATIYNIGDINTVSSAITLRIPPIAFPQESLLQYPYVTFYGYRDFDTNSLVLLYDDTREETNSYTVSIVDSGGTAVYDYSVDDTDTIALNWTLAVPTATYYVTVDVEHGLYGDLSWKQTFYAQGADDEQLFSLGFLGDWAFNTAYILPAFIVLFVAACFSLLNAEAGAILATITAVILTILGWLPIPVGTLVSAFAFSILMALVYNKRRTAVY